MSTITNDHVVEIVIGHLAEGQPRGRQHCHTGKLTGPGTHGSAAGASVGHLPVSEARPGQGSNSVPLASLSTCH